MQYIRARQMLLSQGANSSAMILMSFGSWPSLAVLDEEWCRLCLKASVAQPNKASEPSNQLALSYHPVPMDIKAAILTTASAAGLGRNLLMVRIHHVEPN